MQNEEDKPPSHQVNTLCEVPRGQVQPDGAVGLLSRTDNGCLRRSAEVAVLCSLTGFKPYSRFADHQMLQAILQVYSKGGLQR